jgi:hypothetical protein
MGSFYAGMPVNPHIPIAHVIRKNDDDIGFVLGKGRKEDEANKGNRKNKCFEHGVVGLKKFGFTNFRIGKTSTSFKKNCYCFEIIKTLTPSLSTK